MKQDPKSQTQATVWADLQTWYTGVPGRLLREQEAKCLDDLLADLFGYHALQVGYLAGGVTPASLPRLRNYTIVDLGPSAVAGALGVCGEPTKLPIRSDSVDVVILDHTLDFSPDPHQVLREAERVLIPEGRLLMSNFNPWSLWGVWRLALRGRRQAPWSGNFISPKRLQDWLRLLGFDLEVSRALMFRPPLQSEGLMQRLGFLETAGQRWPLLMGVYLQRAVKRVATLTPIQPAWKRRARILATGAIEPTARHRAGG